MGVFAELIRILTARDREVCKEGLDAARAVARMDGYQELTNRLQLHLNRQFQLQLQEAAKDRERLKEVEAECRLLKDRLNRLEQGRGQSDGSEVIELVIREDGEDVMDIGGSAVNSLRKKKHQRSQGRESGSSSERQSQEREERRKSLEMETRRRSVEILCGRESSDREYGRESAERDSQDNVGQKSVKTRD